jgi:hypothetical protein
MKEISHDGLQSYQHLKQLILKVVSRFYNKAPKDVID